MIWADNEKVASGTNEQSTAAFPQNRLHQRRFANKLPLNRKIGGLPLPHAGPSLYNCQQQFGHKFIAWSQSEQRYY
eukprot:303969-Ditylum_brightwellii.AAC.1